MQVLDAYIIEEIRKREDERRRRDDAARPRVQIDLPRPLRDSENKRDEDPTSDVDETDETDDVDEEDSDFPRRDGIVRIDLCSSSGA